MPKLSVLEKTRKRIQAIMLASVNQNTKTKLKLKPKKTLKRSGALIKPKDKLPAAPVAPKSSLTLSKPKALIRVRKQKKKQEQISATPEISVPPKPMKKKKVKKIATTTAEKKVGSKLPEAEPKKTKKMKKKISATPVLFMVNDANSHLQSVSCVSPEEKPLKKAKKHHQEDKKQMQLLKLPRYVTTGTARTESGLAKKGMEFFYHLGQRKIKDLTEKPQQPLLVPPGTGWNSQLPLTRGNEVPLTGRMPIIDYISTNEFEKLRYKKGKTEKVV